MESCADVLREEFGVASASEPNISRWESGITKRPHCVSQLLAYCDTYGESAQLTEFAHHESWTGHIGGATAAGPAPQSMGDDVDEFDRLAGRVAGEPLLGSAQMDLIKAMTRRIASGPPLSPEDRATYLDLLRILRVPDG
jgi:hypothetical protein